jgi:hypothetical protein
VLPLERGDPNMKETALWTEIRFGPRSGVAKEDQCFAALRGRVKTLDLDRRHNSREGEKITVPGQIQR